MAKKKNAVVATGEPIEIGGEVVEFQVHPTLPARRYFLMPKFDYGDLRQVLDMKVFTALTPKGTGQPKDMGYQREMVDSHRNNLKKAMLAPTYTPTVWAAHVRDSHLENATFHNGRVKLTVSPQLKLDHSDGNHRNKALELIRQSYVDQKDDAAVAFIDKVQVSVQIFLEPEMLQQDFLNFQKGLVVKKAQLESMELHAGLLPPKIREFKKAAHHIGALLFRDAKSHLHGQISFDSKSDSPFSINVLASHSGSTLGNKLYGGALLAGSDSRSDTWMAGMYRTAYQAILERCEKDSVEENGETHTQPSVLVPGNVLCPPLMGGKKGGAEMLIGIGNMLAERCILMGTEEPTSDDLDLLAETVDDVYGVAANGNLSDPRKRELLCGFAKKFFRDVIDSQDLEEYEGIPRSLIDTLSASTFNLKTPPKK